MATTKTITVETTVQLPVARVWELWTSPEHITQWNFASDDWHAPSAENDLRPGGHFRSRMEAKDGSMGFDFTGRYKQVIPNQKIVYLIEDGRKVEITFDSRDGGTTVTETFAAESTHPLDQQKSGWQAILDNFKKYAEATK
ncbi:SRPBCC family protein [Pontibacter sp. E15-1]|uniref:SRPBCC family protein n=1 Tax=Pontibacter sp. E15-1 TaxID=2919918 RepID=UPI001F50047D|nr:SRPBCC family protein [Pontibacter sp. E15-1]MCJ8165417.1 SRPBCC family protein [Pontibacter sp. E15-1]